jgi:predicted RNase H-like HicB family nuclease
MPSLPGCSSQGDTVEEALEMIKDAVKGHLAVQTERKKKKAEASPAGQEQHLMRDSPVLYEVSVVLSGKQDAGKLRAEYQRRLAEKFR